MTRVQGRDQQRRQVYAAEDLASESTVLAENQPLEGLETLVAAAVASSWWVGAGGRRPVEVVVNRSRQRSYWDPVRRKLSLSPLAMNVATVTHELAHALVTDTGSPGWCAHGAEFRGAHVLVRSLAFGDRCGTDLAEVYGQFGLAVDQSPWPTGVTGPLLDARRYDATTIVGRPDGSPRPNGPVGPAAIAL